MSTVDDVTDYLRHRVVGLLHVNLVGPGDRLPSIREMSGLLDADHRTVAKAFRRLEEEGLVEVRPASGVYVASLERTRSGVSSATARWVAEVFLDGWRRRSPRGQVGETVGRVARASLRCACIESTTDHMTALAAELEEDFGLEVERVRLDGDGGWDEARKDAVARCDLAATTVFHRGEATRLTADAGTPLVVVTTHPELARAVDEILERGPTTVVVSDPGTAARMEAHFSVTPHRDSVHGLLAGEVESLEEAEARGRPVLATRAARRALGAEDFHLVPPPPTLVSPESARALLEAIALRVVEGGPQAPTAPTPSSSITSARSS